MMTRPFASALGLALGAARAGCLAAVVAFTALGCSSEPMQKQPALPHLDAEEDWKHSILWLHATDGAPASKEGQCTHVADVIDKEQRCKGTFCQHGAKLAGEWLTKCAKILPDRQQAVSDLQATFEDRAEARQSVCARQYARFMDGCGGQEDCIQRARSWATRCGETEATPLTVAMLEEVLGRTASEEGVTEIKLDARSCQSLGEPLRKGALCADMATCLEAWKQVESYRKRCHTEEQKPPATVAALELIIALGAGQEDTKLDHDGEDGGRLEANALPLMLRDRTGAIVRLCHQRVTTMDLYVKQLAECSGPIDLVRVSGSDAQLVSLPKPQDSELTTIYPELLLAGQLEAQEKVQIAALQRDLVSLIGSASAKGLIELVERHGLLLARSEAARKALRSQDDQLVETFTAIGKAKLAAGRALGDPIQRRALYRRGKTRALADLTPDGSVSYRAGEHTFWLDTAALLPKSTAAYLEAFDELSGSTKFTMTNQLQARVQKEVGKQAQECTAAREEMNGAWSELSACTRRSCDAAELDRLIQTYKASQPKVSEAMKLLDAALSEAKAPDALSALVPDKSCTKPYSYLEPPKG